MIKDIRQLNSYISVKMVLLEKKNKTKQNKIGNHLMHVEKEAEDQRNNEMGLNKML